MRAFASPWEQKLYAGMNDTDDESQINRYEGVLVQNGIIRNLGSYSGRPGLELLGNNTGDEKILGYGVKRNGGTFITRMVNGLTNSQAQILSGNAWVNIIDATLLKDVDIFTAEASNDAVYYFDNNQSGNVGKFDGDLWSTVAAMPKGKFGAEWKNFFWIANGRRLYLSNIGNPEVYTASDYIDFPEEITGIKAYFNRLVVTMKHSIAFIQGSSQSDFVVSGKTIYVPTSFDFGIISHESLQIVGNELWGMDQEGNIRRIFRSDNDEIFGGIVSGKIQNIIDSLNKAQLHKTTAAFVDGYYIFYAPSGASTENDAGAYIDTKVNLPPELAGLSTWIKHTGWFPSHFALYEISGKPSLLIAENRQQSKSYIWFGTSDNGVEIECIFRGKKNDCKYPNQPKLFRFGKQEFEAIGDYTGEIKANIDDWGNNLVKKVKFLGNNKLLGIDWVLGVDQLGSQGRLTDTFLFKDGGGEISGLHVQMELYVKYSQAIPKWFNQTYMFKPLRIR